MDRGRERMRESGRKRVRERRMKVKEKGGLEWLFIARSRVGIVYKGAHTHTHTNRGYKYSLRDRMRGYRESSERILYQIQCSQNRQRGIQKEEIFSGRRG